MLVPADKSKCVLVLDKSDDDIKCQKLLKDKKIYKPIGYNPISGFWEQVTDFITPPEPSVAACCKHAAKLIGNLVGNSSHHLKNTQDFVVKIQNL